MSEFKHSTSARRALVFLIFVCSDPTCLSHLALTIGRPGDWPVSLQGQGELARRLEVAMSFIQLSDWGLLA
jgi:hypothetical protein